MGQQEKTEQELVRIAKLHQLREEGYPYPNDVLVNATSEIVFQRVDAEIEHTEENRERFTVGGRLMTIRLMGKAAFCHLQDRHGQIQLYIKKDEIGEENFERFKTFDLGDIVSATGYAFRTKTNEPSLHVSSVRLLVKCLAPLPEKWHGLTDVETKYRQRYLDLIVNQESRERFRARSKIVSLIRRYFDERDYLEVETPILQTEKTGAAAKPFLTRHNALNLELSLRIATELPLKRLVVGGFERVYEIGRLFRNEGISTQHNPEFTSIEFYQAFATYDTLMEITEELLTMICQEVNGSLQITYEDKALDFSRPWPRYTMAEAIYHFTALPRDVDLSTLAGVQDGARRLGVQGIEDLTDYGNVLFEIFDQCVEHQLINPTFITQHPIAVSPLARPNLSDGRFTDRFELFVAGMELANAFSELNDPEDQRQRFEAQLEAQKSGDEEAMDMDEDFIRALEYGLPPTAGEGIGIDRLVMLLTNAPSIRDVILFPTMRPLHDI